MKQVRIGRGVVRPALGALVFVAALGGLGCRSIGPCGPEFPRPPWYPLTAEGQRTAAARREAEAREPPRPPAPIHDPIYIR